MSESFLDKIKVEKFSDNPGLPANEHAKKKAKEASKAKAEKANDQFVKQVYTQSGSKILSAKISPKGDFQSYVGNLNKKKESAYLKEQIELWKKRGIWISQDVYQEESAKIVQEMTENFEKHQEQKAKKQ
jgi:hypothetical protein